jgi:hypothetical protein
MPAVVPPDARRAAVDTVGLLESYGAAHPRG